MTNFEKFVSKGKQPLKNLVYSFVGLAGETGECMEWLKKSHFRKDKRYNDEYLKLELGDVLHYVTRIGLQKGWTLEDLMSANMKKLEARRKAGKS